MKVKEKGDNIIVTLTVKNTGKHAGKEVVQIYSHAPEGGLDKPKRELKGYAKTTLLKPGQDEKLTITIEKSALASFDEQQSAWIAPKGEYVLMAARDVNTPVVECDFKLTKAIKEKVHDVLGVQPLYIK